MAMNRLPTNLYSPLKAWARRPPQPFLTIKNTSDKTLCELPIRPDPGSPPGLYLGFSVPAAGSWLPLTRLVVLLLIPSPMLRTAAGSLLLLSRTCHL